MLPTPLVACLNTKDRITLRPRRCPTLPYTHYIVIHCTRLHTIQFYAALQSTPQVKSGVNVNTGHQAQNIKTPTEGVRNLKISATPDRNYNYNENQSD